MKKPTEIERARKELEMRVRAEATIIRYRWLCEVLPAMLEAFDHRVLRGEPYHLELPSADSFIEEALKGVE